MGFVNFFTCSTSDASVFAPGGLAMMTMTSVCGSVSRDRIAANVVRPLILSERSLPPVPIACEIPPPALCTWVVNSWRPVPEGPTAPIVPRRTTLANPIPVPLMMLVPQSGPITSKFLILPICFSSSSCSSETLLLKINTFSPDSSALRASSATYPPGMEKTARLAFGFCLRPASSVLTSEAGDLATIVLRVSSKPPMT